MAKPARTHPFDRFAATGLLAALATVAQGQQTAIAWPPVPGMQTSIHETQVTDPLWLAEDCIGAMSLHRAGESTARPRAVADADRLLDLQTRDATGQRGWPYVQALTPAARKCDLAGSLDAFGDGTCNPPETPYMIQTGYAVACLAQVARMTGKAEYLASAIAAIDDSWRLGVENVACPESFEYWYSYHQNDTGRFVRNTNAVMGVGLVRLYEATNDSKYRQRALAIAKAEHCETRAGNYGYFGRADLRYQTAPQRESRRIENHIPHQVRFLQLVAERLGDSSAGQNAHELLIAYLTCHEPHCRPNNCAAWAVPADCRESQSIASCMAAADPQWRAACDTARARFPRLSGFQLYLIEPLIAGGYRADAPTTH